MAISGLGYTNQINRTNHAVLDSIRKISTGSKYPSAAYGAADYAISVRMNAYGRATQQSLQNTQTANSMLQTAAGGVQSTVSALSSLREKLMNAANGTNTDADRVTLAQSAQQTVATLNENAQIRYNGMNLLDGSHASITVEGVDGTKNLQLGDLSARGLGLVDADGNSTLDFSTQEGIASSLDVVESALDKALGQATDIGAAQQNLGFAAANYATQSDAIYGAESASADTDIAAEITKMKSNQTLHQMAMFAQKMFMNQQGMALNLLK